MVTRCDTPAALHSTRAMLLCPQGRAKLWREFVSGVRRERAGFPIQAVLRVALFFGIISYLLYRLSSIGWGEIWGALPTSPLFYALSLGFVLVPVVAEVFSFRIVADRKVGSLSRLFLRKHVLNKAVMSFSGDAYFIHQVARQEGLGLRRAAIIVKDMAIIRIFVSNAWIVILVGIAVAFGNLDVLQTIATVSPALAILVSLVCLAVVGGGLILFRKLTLLAPKRAAKVAAIYGLRSIIFGAILITQWNIAIPGNDLAIWFVFLMVFYIAKKSPVGGELVFVSVIVSLPGLGGDTAEVAAMLIAIAAVSQLFYVGGFVATLETGGLRRVFLRRAPTAYSGTISPQPSVHVSGSPLHPTQRSARLPAPRRSFPGHDRRGGSGGRERRVWRAIDGPRRFGRGRARPTAAPYPYHPSTPSNR